MTQHKLPDNMPQEIRDQIDAGMARAAREWDQYEREHDPTPVTEGFARSVALHSSNCTNYVSYNCSSTPLTFIEFWPGGRVSMEIIDDCGRGNGKLRTDSPTIGQFWTACRLFGVEVSDPDNITPGQAAYQEFIAGFDDPVAAWSEVGDDTRRYWDGVAAAAVRAVGTAFAQQRPATPTGVGVDLNAKLHYLGAVTWTHQQLDEIGKQASDSIATLTAERDRLRDAATNARAELQNYDRYEYGGVNREVVDCIAELDAALATE